VKVAVTGATGLVGGHVAAALRGRGHDVTVLVRRRSSPPDGYRVVQGDVGSRRDLDQLLGGMDGLVHCAAPYSYELSAEELTAAHVKGTRSILEAAAEAGVRRVVVTSSSVTCGSSAGPDVVDEMHRPGWEFMPAYFQAKADQEDLALTFGGVLGLDVVVACPTVVLGGPDRRLVPSNAVLARYLIDPTRSTFPGGCNVVSAPDVGVGHALLLESGQSGARYLLGGQNLRWRELHELVSDLAGVSGPYLEMDAGTARGAAMASELWARLTGSSALVTEEETRTVGRFYWYDHSRAAVLGYAPAGARPTVALALSWLLASSHLPRWVREGLRPSDEVRGARPLVPRTLKPAIAAPARRARRSVS
jgi:dihydroflavonol-4-reductase